VSSTGTSVTKPVLSVFSGFSGEGTIVPLPTSQQGLEGSPGFVGGEFRGNGLESVQLQHERTGCAFSSTGDAGRRQHHPGGNASRSALPSTRHRKRRLMHPLYAQKEQHCMWKQGISRKSAKSVKKNARITSVPVLCGFARNFVSLSHIDFPRRSAYRLDRTPRGTRKQRPALLHRGPILANQRVHRLKGVGL